jgi:fatty acid amide hydrolase
MMTSIFNPNQGITALGAHEMAREIASGALSSREVVEAHIKRIEDVNPQLNAVVVPLFAQARDAAMAADAARACGETLGALHGVPITIKESFDVAGVATTMGLSARLNQKATTDAPLVARLRNAGAIILGKTNVPQLLMMNESDNPVYGRTNNPANLERSCGGSSGGEAAIIAAGGSPLGLGSDIGGSVRLPAHACGIQSLKPTSGRLTMHGHAEIFAGQEAILAQPGPMARKVEDLSLAMMILAAPGQEAFDSTIAPVAWREPAPTLPAGLRVAMFTDNGFFTASPALRRAVLETAARLRERGVVVEEWTPPHVAEAWRIYLGLLFGDGMRGARRALRGNKRDWRVNRINLGAGLSHRMFRMGAVAWELVGQKRIANDARGLGSLSADEYWQLVAERTRYREGFLSALDDGRFDALICPADGLPALRHGASFYLSDALSYTTLFNLLGLPAGVVAMTRVGADEETDRAPRRDLIERAALKVEQGSAGLPVGVQIAARHWREDLVLSIMAAIEKQ